MGLFFFFFFFFFLKARYMNGVGFEILARTPIPQLSHSPSHSTLELGAIFQTLGVLYFVLDMLCSNSYLFTVNKEHKIVGCLCPHYTCRDVLMSQKTNRDPLIQRLNPLIQSQLPAEDDIWSHFVYCLQTFLDISRESSCKLFTRNVKIHYLWKQK